MGERGITTIGAARPATVVTVEVDRVDRPHTHSGIPEVTWVSPGDRKENGGMLGPKKRTLSDEKMRGKYGKMMMDGFVSMIFRFLGAHCKCPKRDTGEFPTRIEPTPPI